MDGPAPSLIESYQLGNRASLFIEVCAGPPHLFWLGEADAMIKRLFGISLVILAVVGLGWAVFAGQQGHGAFPLAVDEERTVILSVDWGGDVHRSERRDCGVWMPSFNCELRRGGGLGIVITQTLPITATASVGEPDTGQWGNDAYLTWDISGLDIGPYESFCRLEVTDGEEMIYGYIEGLGQDGNQFYLVDKFQIGEICFFPLRFNSRLP